MAKDPSKVPFIDLRAQYAGLRDELRAAVDGVMESQQFVLGPHSQALERDLAPYCDAKYAVALANGTDALTIALAACGIGPGDEVIVPFSRISTRPHSIWIPTKSNGVAHLKQRR
jgi:dTDP-4-amino-4,6-dideoxygalactose transaminase